MLLAVGETFLKIFSKISGFFESLPRGGDFFLLRTLTGIIAVGFVAFVTVGIISKNQKMNEKTLLKKAKNVRERKYEYEHEESPKKAKRKKRAYKRALRSMKRTIRRVVFFNSNINITNPYLLDESDSANLALNGKHTFVDYLKDSMNLKNKFIIGGSRKRKLSTKEDKSQNNTNKNVKEDFLLTDEIPYTTLDNEENKQTLETISKEETSKENLEEINETIIKNSEEKIPSVKKNENLKNNSIYSSSYNYKKTEDDEYKM